MLSVHEYRKVKLFRNSVRGYGLLPVSFIPLVEGRGLTAELATLYRAGDAGPILPGHLDPPAGHRVTAPSGRASSALGLDSGSWSCPNNMLPDQPGF